MRRGAILYKDGKIQPPLTIQESSTESNKNNNVSLELPPSFQSKRRATICDKTPGIQKHKRDSLYFHSGALDGHRSSFSGAPPQLRRNSIRVDLKSRHQRYSISNGKSTPKVDVDNAKLTPASEALTYQQKIAFREAFDLFDSNGGGTIDALELKKTLESVGIVLEEEEIHDVMMRLDKDGNGEIDFEEFLNLMTNTEMFLEAFASKHEGEGNADVRQRDVLLFDALTEFMKKSALSEAHEIVGYYAKTYKKAVKSYNQNKGAHVVSHYADGARLIGLTEKQLVMQLKKLTMDQTFGNQGDKDSPYAQPMHSSMLRSITTARPKAKPRKKKKAPPKQQENKDKMAVPQLQSEAVEHQPQQPVITRQPSMGGRGRIKLKIINNNLRKENIQGIEDIHDKTKQKFQKIQKEKDKNLQHKPGWLSQRNIMYNVKIPMPVKYRHVQVNEIKNLRQKVEEAKEKFSDEVAKKKIAHNLNHYRQLQSRKIPSAPLYKQFEKVFCAYSSAEMNERTALSIKQLQKISRSKST